MDKEELDKLIKELESLQVQQEAVIKKIRRASTEEAQSRADRPTQSTPQDNEAPPFYEGQKVLIKNKLSHVRTGRPSIKDRVATVLRTTRKRVHIKTGNSTETSRAPHNITPLSEQEYDKIIKNA